MPGNHPIRRPSSAPVHSDRGERREIDTMDRSARLAHRELQLRREHAQAQIIADTAVTQTAMASVAGTAGCAAVLRDACPEVGEALAFLQAKHLANVAQRMDDFSWKS
jgi:hypothetical protein